MKKKYVVAAVFLLLVPYFFIAQTDKSYRIDSVEYRISGSTREYPLKKAVEIDEDRIFNSEEECKAYLDDITLQFNNLRVLEYSSVETFYGEPDADGIVPVHLIVTTKDTVNIIALPKPGFDSNSGFEMKIKLKNYNFFGSMQELDSDVNYELDEDGENSFSGAISFSIPFEAWGYDFTWDISTAITIPIGHKVIYDLSTGIDMEIPISFFDLHTGFVQSLSVNDRDDDKEYYDDDPLYFTEELYVNIPFTLLEYGTNSEVIWTPQISFNVNWDADTIQADDLKGPEFVIEHELTAGRVDWVGNFRQGYLVSLGNSYTFNMHEDKDVEIQVYGTAQGHYSFFDRVGISSRLHGFYNLYEYISEDQGDKLRGILDKRINTDTGFFLNIDIPVRVMRVDFEEITGIEWTKYISFEMHFSPFFDMALTHDFERNSSYSFKDGWYAGGLEVIVFPMKMRSIYARASVGFDLTEAFENGKLSGNSDRDGEAVRELFIGIGMYY